MSLLTPDRMKLARLRAAFGAMTAEEALNLAIMAEQFANDCGSLDPAWQKLQHNKYNMMEYALILEKAEQS